MTTQISVDVMCNWFGYAPAYRLFIDGDLITERTYLWDNQTQYVREHVEIDINPGQHTIKVEPVLVPGIHANFSLRNFTIDKTPVTLCGDTFTV